MEQLLETPPGDHKHRVAQLAAFGATEEDIAADLQIPLKRLQKRFRVELERGNASGKHEVLEKLFDHARSGSNLGATALWVKARCGWRDTGSANNGQTFIESLLEIKIAPPPPCPTEKPN